MNNNVIESKTSVQVLDLQLYIIQSLLNTFKNEEIDHISRYSRYHGKTINQRREKYYYLNKIEDDSSPKIHMPSIFLIKTTSSTCSENDDTLFYFLQKSFIQTYIYILCLYLES